MGGGVFGVTVGPQPVMREQAPSTSETKASLSTSTFVFIGPLMLLVKPGVTLSIIQLTSSVSVTWLGPIGPQAVKAESSPLLIVDLYGRVIPITLGLHIVRLWQP